MSHCYELPGKACQNSTCLARSHDKSWSAQYDYELNTNICILANQGGAWA